MLDAEPAHPADGNTPVTSEVTSESGTAAGRPGIQRQEELSQEREYVAALYARLDELREEKVSQLVQVRKNNTGGSHQNRSERDAFATMYEDRLAQLNAVDDRLVFGRLDLDSGERRYIGRIGLSTDDLRQLMVDWRAPEAGSFYQATAFERLGVRRRRHLILQRREVAAIEDDVLDSELLKEGEQLQGEGALLAALDAKRTGRMGDIVSTIQAEQDRIVRAPLSGALVVQGGPGTGKTAVALHRAAYLLYTHRKRLGSAGVLVVGPSSSFMEYIERVLPSLGETGVVMASLGRLMPGIDASGVEDLPEVAEIKGREVMAKIIQRAVANRQRVPAEDQTLNVEGQQLTLTAKQVRRARDKARATGKPHNEARLTFVKILLRELTEQLTEKLEAGSRGNTADRSYAGEEVRTARDVRVALNLAWMPMTPERLVSELFAKPAVLEAAAPELSPAQRELLLRDAESPWTESDVPLLDEAAELLGETDGSRSDNTQGAAWQRDLENAEQALRNMQQSLADSGVDGLVSAADLADHNTWEQEHMPPAERAMSDRSWAFGHIVVDEAQELSPMQWRLLARRCPVKSFTIVGDIAQASGAAAAHSWDEALAPHFGQHWHREELTVNYRTPAQIVEMATRMARAAGQLSDISEAQAVREGRWAPVIDHVAEPTQLTEAVTKAVPEELAAVDGGVLAIIATPERIADLTPALVELYGSRVGHGAGSLNQDIVVLSPHDAKGLEFDGVVVVEPAELISGDRVSDLYVAMTRPTQRLRLIHAAELPAGIGD
ncbi:HelD family protein [Acaricomes phytoseiuli]|uniref:HelD family protein n=1 Tax=Acaricomes phytoseiuli TaxID=291968 RepID=UPI000361D0E2|nr:UvrD-helicase domain-containing protein [Acaricomes phytoseiuli]